MEALQAAGIAVPDQVSIVGYDDFGLSTSPALTTIRADLEEVGRLAMEALRGASREKSMQCLLLFRSISSREVRQRLPLFKPFRRSCRALETGCSAAAVARVLPESARHF